MNLRQFRENGEEGQCCALPLALTYSQWFIYLVIHTGILGCSHHPDILVESVTDGITDVYIVSQQAKYKSKKNIAFTFKITLCNVIEQEIMHGQYFTSKSKEKNVTEIF